METNEMNKSQEQKASEVINDTNKDVAKTEESVAENKTQENKTEEVINDSTKANGENNNGSGLSAADLILQRIAKNKNVSQVKTNGENVKPEPENKTSEQEKQPVVKKEETEKPEPKKVIEKVETVNKEKPTTAEKKAPEAQSTGESKADAISEDDVKKDDNSEIEVEGGKEGEEINIEEYESNRPEVDYSKHSQQELIDAFNKILVEEPAPAIRKDVENIKSCFYKLYHAAIAEAKKAFEENNTEEDAVFKPEQNPLEEELKELLNKYREERAEYTKKLEEKKQDNLKKKYQIIEELKVLINGTESIDKTFQEFRELQTRWREIGLVPQSDVKLLWETYHHHVESFYDYIKINKELRDLDLKKNLELKVDLCEKAEELLLESSIVKAFKTLQKYHSIWRETGPVPRDKKDEIWERFKQATTKINKSYQEHFEKIKEEQQNNLKAKLILCEKAEELAGLDLGSHKEWEAKSKELIELQKIWRLIGFAPKKDNNKIYTRFRTACDSFFDKKREYYAQSKEEQENNLQAKTELCMQAESLKDSTDWRKTTDIYINLQKKWKTIGPVPRKHSDAIWKRFRTACNGFFDRKSEHFSKIDEEQENNLKLKLQLIEDVKSFEFSEDHEENLIKLKSLQKQWTEIGHVPIKKKDEILHEFREEINKRFDSIKLDDMQRQELKFKNKIESWQTSNKGHQKIKYEREKLANKLREIENDIVVWENNIGFFAKSKNAESMIIDVKNKIKNAKEKADALREKIKMMDKMED